MRPAMRSSGPAGGRAGCPAARYRWRPWANTVPAEAPGEARWRRRSRRRGISPPPVDCLPAWHQLTRATRAGGHIPAQGGTRRRRSGPAVPPRHPARRTPRPPVTRRCQCATTHRQFRPTRLNEHRHPGLRPEPRPSQPRALNNGETLRNGVGPEGRLHRRPAAPKGMPHRHRGCKAEQRALHPVPGAALLRTPDRRRSRHVPPVGAGVQPAST